MPNELTPTQQTAELTQQMEYARVVSSGDLLPTAYRGKPANVLIALGLGQAMGLSPAESLYRIDVIQGKPTASAELIAANVRKAGHKVRLRVDEAATSATCTIIRKDDPDYEHTVVRDQAWAQRMGLLQKDNYKKQPATMLGWRAITACARMACPEALYGVAYTPDELDDMPRVVEAARPQVTAETFTQTAATDVTDAEVVEDSPPKLTAAQRKRLFAAFTAKGVPEADQKRGIEHVIQRTIEHRDEITDAELDAVLAVLDAKPDATPEQADTEGAQA